MYLLNSSSLLQILVKQNSTNLIKCNFGYFGKSITILFTMSLAWLIETLACPKAFKTDSISLNLFENKFSDSEHTCKISSNTLEISELHILVDIIFASWKKLYPFQHSRHSMSPVISYKINMNNKIPPQLVSLARIRAIAFGLFD